MGYYFIIVGIGLENDVRARRALDEDVYDVSKAVTLRIPIALPYQYDNADFMRVEGKFLHNGKSYRLIKQKYASDTLTVVCIEDEQDRQIQQALADVAGSYTDSAADNGTPSKSQSLFIKEYIGGGRALISSNMGWVMDLPQLFIARLQDDVFLPMIPDPPES